MIKKFSVGIFFAILTVSFMNAQTLDTARIVHPTIENFKVIYKSAQNPNRIPGVWSGYFGVPLITVKLKPSANATAIFFKIIDPLTDSVLYSSSHSLSSQAMIHGSGIKIFENNSGTVSLSSAEIRLLKAYSFKIQTEDSLHNLSPLFVKMR